MTRIHDFVVAVVFLPYRMNEQIIVLLSSLSLFGRYSLLPLPSLSADFLFPLIKFFPNRPAWDEDINYPYDEHF